MIRYHECLRLSCGRKRPPLGAVVPIGELHRWANARAASMTERHARGGVSKSCHLPRGRGFVDHSDPRTFFQQWRSWSRKDTSAILLRFIERDLVDYEWWSSRSHASQEVNGNCRFLFFVGCAVLAGRESMVLVFVLVQQARPPWAEAAAAAAYTLGPTTDNRADSTDAYTSTYHCIRFTAPREHDKPPPTIFSRRRRVSRSHIVRACVRPGTFRGSVY